MAQGPYSHPNKIMTGLAMIARNELPGSHVHVGVVPEMPRGHHHFVDGGNRVGNIIIIGSRPNKAHHLICLTKSIQPSVAIILWAFGESSYDFSLSSWLMVDNGFLCQGFGLFAWGGGGGVVFPRVKNR